MFTLERRLLVLALSVGTACHGGPGPAGGPRVDLSVITEEQLSAQHYANLFDAVQALRSNWLSPRGTDSFRAPSVVWVYLDNQKFGSVQSLSSITTHGVLSITHLDGVEATARWGIGHSAGVISVLTWPSGESGRQDARPRQFGLVAFHTGQ